MKIKSLIITGIVGVVLSFFVITGFLMFVMAPLNHQQITDYQSNELVKQFHESYPQSGMTTMSGTLFEDHISFTWFKNARYVSLTFSDGMDGQKITYKCERIISSEEPVEIFYFEEPTPEIIKNNVCGEYD
ncbi:MAG: hypothetical protein K5793_00030 [Nitrosarchaeum sp.]|nr:hypothetical protein [Nitrosarchaeum sp.]